MRAEIALMPRAFPAVYRRQKFESSFKLLINAVSQACLRYERGKSMKKEAKTAIILIVLVVLIVVVPLFARKGAEFGGSDDAGSQKIEEIAGEYEPWFTPVFETALNGEIPGEVESLLFCVQTGIGVGIIAFLMGRMVERKKWCKE